MESGFSYSDLASLTVALVAVGIAIWNGYLVRRHYRLSVRPRLRISHRFRDAIDFYGIRIINGGLGPAIITDVELLFDGEAVNYSHQGWMDALRNAGLNPDQWSITRLLVGTVLKTGEQVWLFRTQQLPESANQVIRKLSRIEIVIHYDSLYKERQPSFRGRLASKDFVIEKGLPHPNAAA